jgi:hypothetical protein
LGANPKQAALRIIARMPEDSSLEEVMYELYFRQRVERGLLELQYNKTPEHREVYGRRNRRTKAGRPERKGGAK